MSKKELTYDIEELNCVAKIARDIAEKMEDTAKMLDNPEKHTHEEISEAWIAISSLLDSMKFTKKIIHRGATHGLSYMIEGFEHRNKGAPPQSINPIFIDGLDEKEEEDNRDKKQKDITEEFMSFLKKLTEK